MQTISKPDLSRLKFVELRSMADHSAYQPRRILVTGGCGFIGTNFIKYLLDNDDQVFITNYDKLTYAGNLENLKEVEGHPRYKFIKGDITDQSLLSQTLQDQEIDSVINFAAESHVDRSILDSEPFVRTNVLGTQALLDASRHHGVSRYLQVSTDEVYGSLGSEGYFTEQTPLAPNSPYSASKAAADLLVRSYCETFGFPAMITRCSNNYGPYQFPEKLLPLFISNALRDMPLPVYGDGKNVRDWIHVLDHCRGIHAALCRGVVSEIYNFGGRSELENIQLIELLLQLLDKPKSLIQFVKDRPGHDRRYAIDCSKAEQQLQWSIQYSLDKGLSETVEWYLNHEDWVERVRSGDYQNYYEQQYAERLSS